MCRRSCPPTNFHHDGQIYLVTSSTQASVRHRPGISVSRVEAPPDTIIKKLGGGIRLALAQYRDLAAFAQFASDLDAATRRQLERGQRVTEMMKQNQYEPLTVAEVAVSLFAVQEGYMDDMEVDQLLAFEKALLAHARDKHAELLDTINESGDYNDEIQPASRNS